MLDARNEPITTKKAARAAGLRTYDEHIRRSPWYPSKVIPRRDAKPTVVKNVCYYSGDDCEDLVSRTEAKRRRLRIPDEAEPVTHDTYRERVYPLYRISDCQHRPERPQPPARCVGLLAALFAVNRAAKRCRDN